MLAKTSNLPHEPPSAATGNPGRFQPDRFKVVTIAASAGGFEAIATVLSALPAGFALPIVIVLHRSATSQGLTHTILARKTPLPVKAAREGDVLTPGTVFIAPADMHLRVKPDRSLSLSDGQRIRHVLSSANPLFESAGSSFGPGVIAVVLSGSGQDATDGVQTVRGQGGIVIAQDKATAHWFEMPASAIRTGAVDYVLPIQDIASALVALAATGTYTPANPSS